MPKLLTLNFRSVVLFFHTLVWTFIGMTAALLHPTGKVFMRVAQSWGRQVLWLAGVKLAIRGKENVDSKTTYVVCANHQSQIDIPLLFYSLPVKIRFLAKRSLFFIPFFGWSLYLAGFIPVDRGNTSKAKRSIERGAKRIKKGPSLMVFPEGTRTHDGDIHKFKSGAFILAMRSQTPILPVAIQGSFDVIPKSSLGIRPGPVKVVIGKPIPTQGLTMKEKESLLNNTQQAVQTMLDTGEPV